MISQAEKLRGLYQALGKKHEGIREWLGSPLTLAEKILYSHLNKIPQESPVPGETNLSFIPDRVAMQDATAQMAVLQFMVTGLDTVQVPVTIHCDHLVLAYQGSESDLSEALKTNGEVYEFLKSAAAKYGMGFWEPGSGIIHQVVLEQYAAPGTMMVGTDSHTPNAGGLGMLAIGVGGADAVDVMAGLPWSLTVPKILGVHLKGQLSGWASPKDVILKLLGKLTVKGGTGKVVEYFGEGAGAISCTGKATIANMGAELGATCSIFPYDEKMSEYLRRTGRIDLADLADQNAEFLKADSEVGKTPERYYDEVVEIDLSLLEPHWVGPHSPDLLTPVSLMKEVVKKNGYPDEIKAALIGSCTNSSYEDLSRSAAVARQALEKGVKPKAAFYITPGSDQVYQTIKQSGILDTLTAAGGTVLCNACGPCIGQWKRKDFKEGTPNTIVTSYNRNFAKRNDGNTATCAFIGSPELVTAAAFSGSLSFNPLTDSLKSDADDEILLEAPEREELPEKGFVLSQKGFIEAPGVLEDRNKLRVLVNPDSERLALLESFSAWDGKDFTDLVLLLKAKGKCTTDHISQAGTWLRYRGHLDNISNNLYLGAVNAFSSKVGVGRNVITDQQDLSFPEIARDYKANGIGWIVVGDENYGEGSSREHAAMEPRHLGCRAVIAKSFARIAETNLKKQGVLPLTFKNPSDYERIKETDRFDLLGLSALSPGGELVLQVKPVTGDSFKIFLSHTLTKEQIEWFKSGSALNMIRENLKTSSDA